jgi:hypothetical protein
MSRLIPRLTGLAALVVAMSALMASSAFAANLVDGSVSALGKTCSWTNGSTTADPPSALTINGASVNSSLTCSSGVTATLNNSPGVTFDDTAGTATADTIDATVNTSGQSCRYSASNVLVTRSGSTRDYSGTASAPKVSGSFLCPGSVDLTTSVSFH